MASASASSDHEHGRGEDSDDRTSDVASVVTNTPPKKKSKRLSRYRQEWQREFSWCAKVQGNVFAAQCTLCKKCLSCVRWQG